MDQTEELQLIDVEVANRLHGGQLGHHLCEREKQRGEFTDTCLHGDGGRVARLHLVQLLIGDALV